MPSMTRLFREHVAAFKERQQDAISLAFPPQPPPPAHTVFQPHVPGLGGPPPPAQGLYGGLAGPMQYGGGDKKAGAQGGPAGPPVPAGPKMKASNFTGSSLRVGTWKKDSVYEGDLVAKFYYAKRKLVWEVLEAGLKSKIEVLWDSVTSLKCHIARGAESYLEVEVNAPPAMYRESNPQPRKHTIWQPCPDFTDGQAAVATVHCVTFPAGVLNKHYYKLLQSEPRLAVLAAKSGSPTLAGDSFFKPAELSSSPPPLVEEDSSKGASCEEADSEQVPLKKGAADAPGALPSPHRASARPKRAAAAQALTSMAMPTLGALPRSSALQEAEMVIFALGCTSVSSSAEATPALSTLAFTVAPFTLAPPPKVKEVEPDLILCAASAPTVRSAVSSCARQAFAVSPLSARIAATVVPLALYCAPTLHLVRAEVRASYPASAPTVSPSTPVDTEHSALGVATRPRLLLRVRCGRE